MVNKHGQARPTEHDAVAALAELVGPEMAAGLWELSVRALRLQRPVDSVTDLRVVAEHLITTGELVRVAGRSLKVRAITFNALSRTDA